MATDHASLLSVAQASSRLGISVFTLRMWLRQGRLPHIRLGRRVLLRPEDVDAFVLEHLIAPPSTSERRS